MESHKGDAVENSPPCVPLVRPLVKTFLFHIVSRTERDANRASLYYLDIPVLSSVGDDYETLRVLLQTHERNQGPRSIRPRIAPLSLGDTNLKFTPYDCCSFLGERDVSLESLLSIFRPLHELAKHAQVRLSNIV